MDRTKFEMLDKYLASIPQDDWDFVKEFFYKNSDSKSFFLNFKNNIKNLEKEKKLMHLDPLIKKCLLSIRSAYEALKMSMAMKDLKIEEDLLSDISLAMSYVILDLLETESIINGIPQFIHDNAVLGYRFITELKKITKDESVFNISLSVFCAFLYILLFKEQRLFKDYVSLND